MTKKHDHEYCKVISSYSIYTTKEFSLFMSDGILNGKVIQQQERKDNNVESDSTDLHAADRSQRLQIWVATKKSWCTY